MISSRDFFEPPAHIAAAVERARRAEYEALRISDHGRRSACREAWAEVDALVRQGWARWCPDCMDGDTCTGHAPGDPDAPCPSCLGWMLLGPVVPIADPARPRTELRLRVATAWEDAEELARVRAAEANVARDRRGAP